MAKHDDAVPRGTFQPVYSNQFLVDGTWYVTVVCPIHGLHDESVEWAEAKTPHHAGVIADSRHVQCSLDNDVAEQARAKAAEIDAARVEVERVEGLLAVAREAGDEKLIAVHERGLRHARRRHQEIAAHNA